jgi:hypothetical protein
MIELPSGMLHLSTVMNICEWDSQRWLMFQVVPVYRFDWRKLFLNFP